mmetsp:Transcript_21679/g.52388  ORF Transcript_21679/g.52388 Transcript_21679/m.52388 type:complete len:679 (-) Transcript_21679:93-2129(-)|eukprot:CAMPEP_0181093134 /NCGR_PEP_ID=MMETSP1071-20121207/9286_1 /TAXON_ID=35127 /ORGANISM="Thalassiosira sp., Strain NH16" /LENGTH=678 /DNA_ID=CAMNT_0023175353 /DNA_START=110 /DNA_END=2146 /DNA_ORIENTATION=+
MTKLSPHLGVAALLTTVATIITTSNAFAPPSTLHKNARHHAPATTTAARSPPSTSSSSSSLNAVPMPMLIIGPMIRRMREEKDKKNAPMASGEEAKSEAPGLRVGANAWKWPPVWPYDGNFFKRTAELNSKGNNNPLANPMAMMTGDADANSGENSTDVVFDSMKFWEDKSEVRTDLDARVAEKITNHYSFYLRDGMSILELGAAENSYLPPSLKPNKHVGVGAVQSQMEANPSITSSMVVDLNKVIEDEGVDNDDFEKLCDEGFDAVIMANTIDFLVNPREVFKSSWRALKPGGIMIVPFLAKDAYVEKFDEAFTKQWRDMTDDQHLWVAGSFFQFSAGEGWEGLKGFDISPEDAKKEEEGMLAKLQQKDSDAPCGAFVVQGKKKSMAEEVDENDVEGSIKSRLWMLPTLEDRDKKLVAPRLARAYDSLDSQQDKDLMFQHCDSLPKIYASLIKMDQFAFTFSMQAQLAADLVGDPDFEGNDLQINNLKMGLGLRKPSKDFWAPVGKLTAAMAPEEKVNLLAYIVPRFGSEDPAQGEALEAFVAGLEPTFAVIRSKCPNMKEADVQLLGSELLASEVLKPGLSSREEFAVWMGALSEVDLEFILTKRKSFKEEAKQEMESFKEEREAETKRVEERREKIQEQVMAARENRSVVFNPRTGKMEQIEKKGDGFFQNPFN